MLHFTKNIADMITSLTARYKLSNLHYNTLVLLTREKLSSFLSLNGAYTFNENKHSSYGLDKRQLKCAKFWNISDIMYPRT